jgi:hypothetical protein
MGGLHLTHSSERVLTLRENWYRLENLNSYRAIFSWMTFRGGYGTDMAGGIEGLFPDDTGDAS